MVRMLTNMTILYITAIILSVCVVCGAGFYFQNKSK